MDLPDTDFKSASLNLSKELKETMKKHLTKKKKKNVNKEIEIIKRNQIKILQLKSTITEMKIY